MRPAPTGTWLHVRARGGHRFVAGLTIVAALGWVAAQWLATRPFFDGPGARVPVVAVAPLAAALLLGTTLAGADEQMERGLPVRWRRWRFAHLTASTVMIAAALSLIGLRSPETYGAYALIRNAIGLVGMVAGAAVGVGPRLFWLLPFGYVCAIYAAHPARDGGPAQIWAWPVQPSWQPASWWTAIVVALIGGAAYTLRGAGGRDAT
jgi:hypothetical protein